MNRKIEKIAQGRDGESRINYRSKDDEISSEGIDISDVIEGVEEPYKNEQVLRDLFLGHGLTASDIADELDKSNTVISLYLNRYNIKQ